MSRAIRGSVWGVVLALVLPGLAADAQVRDEHVLVVYNSAVDADSGGGGQILYEYYRSLPGRDQVIGLDLNDPTLLPGNISYDAFKSKLRDPIRAFLTGNNLEQQVLVILLTRGIPHRVADVTDGSPVANNANNLLGDNPGSASTAFNDSQLTCASVDSELALLFQDLDNDLNVSPGSAFHTGSANYIRNPFFNATSPITASNRSAVQAARSLVDAGSYQQLTPNPTSTRQLFLTCRLDGDSVQDVVDALHRANNAVIDPDTDHIILDEFDPASGGPDQGDGSTELDGGGLSSVVRSIDAGGDFDQLAADLAAAGYAQVEHDEGVSLLIGASGSLSDQGGSTADTDTARVTGPVAALFTLGGNHAGDSQNDYLGTFVDPGTGESQFVDGACFSSVESYNARALGGLSTFTDQGSVAEFIASGGTFAVGTVFEPFTLGVNEADILFGRHVTGGWTFVEAAFASVPFVSSQSIIIGDPLATVTVGPRPVALDEGLQVRLTPVLSFQTELGVRYTVLKSTDGRSFTAFAEIVGNGLVMSLPDASVQADASAIYRVQVQ